VSIGNHCTGKKEIMYRDIITGDSGGKKSGEETIN